MKKRALCWMLVLVMVVSLLPTFAAAEGERVLVDQNSSDTQNGDLHMTKSLYKNSDGTYDITIESWATGEVESHVVNQAVPTDFVLILDQSGSMYEQDIPTGYSEAGNSWRPNDFLQVTVNSSGSRGNSMSVNSHDYYYNIPGTNEYYPVYWKNRPDDSFMSIDDAKALDCTTYEGLGDIGGYSYEYGNCDARYSGQMEPMYYKAADGSYYRIYTYSEGLALRYHITMFYYDAQGNRHDLGTYTYTWASVLNNRVTFDVYTNKYYTRTGNWLSGYKYTQHPISNGYKPYYTDANGVEHQLPGSWSVNGEGDVFYNGVLYEKNEEVTRVSALETAVSKFVDLVNTKAVSDDVNHKVAVIGFSDNDGDADNTELLSTGSLSTVNGSSYYYDYKLFPYGYNYNGPEYDYRSTTVGGAGGISVANYQAALQDASTAEGVATLKQAAHAVTACGGTEPEYGFYMAENVLRNRTETTYDVNGQPQKRNTVVIFFTDGQPGMSGTSDQIAAANTVVNAANRLKTNPEFNYTKVYSIGVFDTGDDQPLTFTKTGQNNADAADNYISHKNISGTEYYYYRGNKVSETSYNDTIKDYMECVSSQYPNAANFLNHSGTSATGTSSNNRGAENQDQMTYYMRVTDAGGLERAFASIASTVDTSTTSATLNDSAVLRDTVYTGDFDVSGASVEAKSVKVQMVNGEVRETGAAGTASPTVTESVRTDGRLSVTGFDYSALYTSANKPGEKLVVTIKNVVPKTSGHLWSNSGNASIYPGANSSDAVIDVASPEENIGSRTVVMDFGATAVLAQAATGENAKTNLAGATSTHFVNDNSKVTFSYDKNLAQADGGTVDLSFSGVESAMVYGKQVTGTAANGTITTEDTAVWKQVNIIPANTIYFDDTMESTEAGFDANGVGYNAALTGDTTANDVAGNDQGQATFTFTFKGTGIDVYCTTDATAGWIQANVDGTNYPFVNSRYQESEGSTTAIYNTPVISIDGLAPNVEHTLTLRTLTNSNFRLDGIRVYNPMQNVGDAETQSKVNAAYDAADESNAVFLEVRDRILAANAFNYEGAEFESATITGAVFLETQATGATITDYEAKGPKEEVYLAPGQAIAFNLGGWTADTYKVMVGLSMPKSTDATSATVYASGRGQSNPITVSSRTDMFYQIYPDANGNVIIKNNGAGMISITKLKITTIAADGTAYTVPAQTTGEAVEPGSRGLQVNRALMSYAMAFDPATEVSPADPVDEPDTPDTPDEPDDTKPGWSDDAYNPVNILKTLFKLLLQSLGSLFGGLGNW